MITRDCLETNTFDYIQNFQPNQYICRGPRQQGTQESARIGITQTYG